jgi:anti-sigma B factor antagonist
MELSFREQDGTKVVRVHGRLDVYSSQPLRDLITEAASTPPACLVISLEGVSFIDSTALAILVQGMKQCRALNGDLRICGLGRPVRMIFELTRLDQAFEIFATEGEAVVSFALESGVEAATPRPELAGEEVLSSSGQPRGDSEKAVGQWGQDPGATAAADEAAGQLAADPVPETTTPRVRGRPRGSMSAA